MYSIYRAHTEMFLLFSLLSMIHESGQNNRDTCQSNTIQPNSTTNSTGVESTPLVKQFKHKSYFRTIVIVSFMCLYLVYFPNCQTFFFFLRKDLCKYSIKLTWLVNLAVNSSSSLKEHIIQVVASKTKTKQ